MGRVWEDGIVRSIYWILSVGLVYGISILVRFGVVL